MASTSSWKILTQSATLLLRCTVQPSHFAPPHPGSMNTMGTIPQGSRWWWDKPNGEHAAAQFSLVVTIHTPLHTQTTPLQLVLQTRTSLSLMHSQAARLLFFLGIVNMLVHLPSHQMVHCLYLGVQIRLSSSGMSRLVELSKPSVATLIWSILWTFQQTTPWLLQDLGTIQFVCGRLGQGSVIS